MQAAKSSTHEQILQGELSFLAEILPLTSDICSIARPVQRRFFTMRSPIFLFSRNSRLLETAKFGIRATSRNSRQLAARHYSSNPNLDSRHNEGPLRGLRVLDLSRVLAVSKDTKRVYDKNPFTKIQV